MSTKTQLLALAGVLVLFVGTIALYSLLGIWFWASLLAIASLLISLIVSLAVFVFISKFILVAEENHRKNPERAREPRISLKHDPDKHWSPRLAIQVDENRAAVIERAGVPIRIIHGGAKPTDTMYEEEWRRRTKLDKNNPEHINKATPVIIRLYKEDDLNFPFFGKLLFRLFRRYELYIYKSTGLYVYVPYFTKPNTKPLPRYKVTPKDGKNVYEVVEKGDSGFYTNHVRTALTTWYFEYNGVDIDGIPFEVTGSVQYSIAKDKVREALYKTDAWNVLLDQADFTVIRSTVKDEATVDNILGKIEKDNWKARRKSKKNLFEALAIAVFENLKGYEFDVEPSDEHPDGKMKLEDVGIIIHKVMFNDFEPKLTPEELLQLRAPALQQRVARGIESVGRANAAAQAELIKVHKDGGETSDRILQADALVRATQNSGGKNAPSLGEALLASIAQGNMKGK